MGRIRRGFMTFGQNFRDTLFIGAFSEIKGEGDNTGIGEGWTNRGVFRGGSKGACAPPPDKNSRFDLPPPRT